MTLPLSFICATASRNEERAREKRLDRATLAGVRTPEDGTKALFG